MMQPSDERRQKRIDRICSVRVRLFKEGQDAARQRPWEMVTMQNLSATGILFTTTEKLPTGIMLEFMISSPKRPDPIYCVGQVIRVEESQRDKLCVSQITIYSVAVFFINISTDNQEAIKKICEAS
jgi:hypothetical protein